MGGEACWVCLGTGHGVDPVFGYSGKCYPCDGTGKAHWCEPDHKPDNCYIMKNWPKEKLDRRNAVGEGLKRARKAARESGKVPDKKTLFIKALAGFLAGNQAGKSIELEMESRSPRLAPMTSWAQEWAKLRDMTPLFGYPTVEEAERSLMEFLR